MFARLSPFRDLVVGTSDMRREGLDQSRREMEALEGNEQDQALMLGMIPASLHDRRKSCLQGAFRWFPRRRSRITHTR